MRILFLFLDMVRPALLDNPKDHLPNDNPLAATLNNIGGTRYTNCFTPAPDTTRSMAALWSGAPPWHNKCDTRIKWPKYFLDSSKENLFDDLIEQGFELSIFHEPAEREVGIFPENVYSNASFNEDYNIASFLGELQLKRKHFVFLGISDFHLKYNYTGYTKIGATEAFSELDFTVNQIFSNLDKDDFDHIFIFSDHGFAFSEEVLRPHNYVSSIRSKILMIHREKGGNEYTENNKFCSIMSLYPTLTDLFQKENRHYDYSLFSENERKYITIEDHFNYQPRINHNIDVWGLITRNNIYSRTLDAGYLIDNQFIDKYDEGIRDDFDDILKSETSFGRYQKEWKMLQRHTNWMKHEQMGWIPTLSNGNVRVRQKLPIGAKVGKAVAKLKSKFRFKKDEGFTFRS